MYVFENGWSEVKIMMYLLHNMCIKLYRVGVETAKQWWNKDASDFFDHMAAYSFYDKNEHDVTNIIFLLPTQINNE